MYEPIELTFCLQPTVGEADIDQLVQDKALLACHQMHASASTRIEVVVFFLHLNVGLDEKIGGPTPSAYSPSSAGMAMTAANAASSLRAWASPRNYPYSWLAHAFSGGAGQAGGGSSIPTQSKDDATQASPLPAQEEYTALQATAFEQWTITFNLVTHNIIAPQTDPSRVASQEMTAQSLSSFLDKLLFFVEQNKNHLPAITSADLCPFPLRILVR